MQTRRLGWLAPLALAGVLVAPGAANSATKYDTSYANGGMLMLPAIKGVYGQVATSCEVSGRRLHIAGEFGPVPPAQSLATTSVKVRPRQAMTLGVANVRWKKQRTPTGHTVLSEDFDIDGGFAYATQTFASRTATKLMLFRLDARGNRVKKFGRRGFVTVAVPASKSGDPLRTRVIALPAGRVLLLNQNKAGQTIRRFTSRGKLDGSWGTAGVVKLPTPNVFEPVPIGSLDSASETLEGGLLISASGTPTAPDPNALGVIKLGRSGAVDSGWASGGLWTPPVPDPAAGFTYTGRSLLISAQSKDSYAIVYADGAAQPEGDDSSLMLVRVDAKTGKINSAVHGVGSHYNGGDTGFPSAEPWALLRSPAGPTFAYAESYYERPGGSFRGAVTEVQTKPGASVIRRSINNTGFAIGAFAADPAQPYVYTCGSFGVTSSRIKDPERSRKRKNVAIKRIKL